MAKNSSKRVRKTALKYFVAKQYGIKDPVMVVAKTKKIALDIMLALSEATPADLVNAGRKGYAVIDTTVPAEQTPLLDTKE
jgi:hypothetical protein